MIKLNHCLPKVPWFTLLGWFLIFRHLDQLKMRSSSFTYKLTELTNITAFWIFIRINISLSLLPSFSSSTSTRMLSFGGCYWIRLAKQAVFFAIMTVYIFLWAHCIKDIPKTLHHSRWSWPFVKKDAVQTRTRIVIRKLRGRNYNML